MTMSVGLGRIINDPQATLLTRKALGALSTPHLLCDDQGITMDDQGRFVIKLKADGGLLQGVDGLYTEQTFGVDSAVDVHDDATGNRDWNMNITGTAPNYIESDVLIGTTDHQARSTALEALEFTVEDAKVNIESRTRTQLRLRYDPSNFANFRVMPTGFINFYSVGSAPAINLYTGNAVEGNVSGGISFNGGTQIQQIYASTALVNFAGGGAVGAISYAEYTIAALPTGFTADDDTCVVTVSPIGSGIQAAFIGWTVHLESSGLVTIRITWIGVAVAENRYWLWQITKFAP